MYLEGFFDQKLLAALEKKCLEKPCGWASFKKMPNILREYVVGL